MAHPSPYILTRRRRGRREYVAGPSATGGYSITLDPERAAHFGSYDEAEDVPGARVGGWSITSEDCARRTRARGLY